MSTDLATDIKKEIAAQMAALNDAIPRPTGYRISTKGKMFTLPTGESHPGPMRVIILDFMNYNVFYSNTYDPNTVSPPVCWSLNRAIQQMEPSEAAPDRQAPNCSVCPKNQFKSGNNGRGKACRNMVRLAVISPKDAGPNSEIMVLDVAPTSLRAWGNYVKSVAAQFSGPPICVSTEVKFDPNVTYPALLFGDPQAHDHLETIFPLQREAQRLLLVEPSVD